MIDKQKETTVNREYKSRMFAMLFSNKKELLGLYNAVNGTHYTDEESLEINTLENAVYMSMRNDVSCIIDMRLALYEHQSTYSPNLPLRYLMYVADIYSAFTRNKNLYGTKLVKIPTPKFVIFYNRQAEQPEIKEGILADFLRKNRAEAKKVSIYEYDEQQHMDFVREEGIEEGVEKGVKALIETLAELGMDKSAVIGKLMEKFSMNHEAAEGFTEKYWVG